MPTLPDLAFDEPFATSPSLLRARIETAPVPAATTAPAATIACVWLVTMFRPSAPAMLTLPLAPSAPERPSALIACSARRK